MRTLNNFCLFGEKRSVVVPTEDCDIILTANTTTKAGELGERSDQTINLPTSTFTCSGILLAGQSTTITSGTCGVEDTSASTSATTKVGFADTTSTTASTLGRAMSRRKQFRPRHLDSEDGDLITGTITGTVGTVGVNTDSTTGTQLLQGQHHSVLLPGLENQSRTEGIIKGLNPELKAVIDIQDSQPKNSMSEGPSSSSPPVKSFDSDMPTLHRHDVPLQNGQDNYFGSPTHRMTKPTNRPNSTNDTKRAVVSPLSRTPPGHQNNAEPMIQQPVAPSITPAEMERQYFQNIAAAARASAVAAAAAATDEQMRKDDYSDDDDVPSDIESCANESELQEEMEKPQEHHTTTSATAKFGDQEDQSKKGEKQTEKMIDNEGNEDDAEYLDGNNSATGAVQLKALETTNVAVAQVVENNNNEVREQLPNLQQVLFTLHQQQMFQLQVLQQIQQQVTKIAHHDGDMNGLKDDATAALYTMMGRGMPQGLQSSGSDDSCGADDISEGSIGSAEGHLVDNMEDIDQSHLDSSPFEGHKSHVPIHEYISPAGSPETDNDGSTANTSGSMEEELRKPAFPGDNEDCFKHGPPVSRHMPSIPYLGGLGGHVMPGSVNPLLPSNVLGMPSPMQGSGGMGFGRFPMFRSPVMPRQDEDETLEEFMEIDTSDTAKLEEFMKKVEPTLKDPNQCAVCKKILSCKSALQMHYRTHTGSRPFKCKICSRAFTTKGNLKTHMSVHRSRPTGPSLHQCPVCSKKFNSVLHLQDHMRMHIGEFQAPPMPKHPMMPMLPQGFMPFMNYPLVPSTLPQDKKPNFNGSFSAPKEEKDLNSSFERKSPIINSVEPVKRPPVDSVEELRQKRQRTDILEPPKLENDRPYLTPEKNMRSDNEHSSPETINPYSASLLALEESVKEMDKKMAESSNFFVKTEDSKHFVGSEKLGESLHSRVMTANVHKDDLQSRMESVQTSVITQVPTSQHKAPLSGPIISLPPSQSIANSHSPPSCPTSPFSSGRRQSLRHVCSVCHKPFSSSSALQIHMRTHTGERPFKCNVCDKAFTTKGNLKVHMSTHAIVTGPPRRGRRMSMENLPPFSSPGQFPPVMPRPPMGMFPSFPYSNMFLPGKGMPFMPPVGLMPGNPMGLSMFGPRKEVEEKESSLSPISVMDLHKASDTSDNNNGPSKGIHGELDLSIRAPSQQAIKT